MSWIILLGIAVVFTAIAALLGAQPAGGRPVSGTQMMQAARYVLFAVAAVLVLLAFRSYFAG